MAGMNFYHSLEELMKGKLRIERKFMSIRVGGVFNLILDVDIYETVSLSLTLLQFAFNEHIGLLQGGNAKFQNTNHPQDINENTIAFDITDDPLDNNADCLFGGDGIEIYVNDTRVDGGKLV